MASPTPLPSLAPLVIPDRLATAWPADRPARRARLPPAELSLHAAVHVALPPTLVRVWCRRGRRDSRTVQAPGTNAKRAGFGVVDGRSGWFDGELADGRTATPFCARLRRVVVRARARGRGRGRVAIVLLANRSSHPPRGAKRLRALLEAVGDDVILVYPPPSDPDSNRIAWRWRAVRRAVTHTDQRTTFAALLADADDHVGRGLPPELGGDHHLPAERGQGFAHEAPRS